jgi:cytoskeletal protein RodZ
MPAKIPKPTIFSMPKTHKGASLGEKTGKKTAVNSFPGLNNIEKASHSASVSEETSSQLSAKETQKLSLNDQNRSKNTQEHLKNYLLAVKETGCSNSTIRNYRSDINQFLSFLESNDLEDLKSKPKLVAFAQYQRDKGLKENSIRRKLVSVTQFKIWLKEKGILSSEIPLTPELEKAAANELKTIEPQKFSQEEKEKSQEIIEKLKHENSEKDAKILEAKANPEKKKKKERNGLVFAFNILALLVFLGGLAFFAYQQFGQAVISMAYPSTPTRTSRILSYQGRLTDTAQNPINAVTNMSYKLYDADTAGTELWSSNTCAVDPDQDGIFNVNLGAGTGSGTDDESCGAEIDNSVFTENANVWLEVTIGAETLAPRQPIRTVAYAINAETLQGLPPAEVATNSTILMMDQNGEVVLGTTTPVLKSDSGSSSLTIESNQLILRTATGSNGDVVISPDGAGQTLINSDLTLDGYLFAPGATLSATYAGGTALILKGGPSGTANIQEWQDSTGSVLSYFDSAGAANLAGLTINSAYTFPTADGTANQVLQTDGSGNVSWGNASSGSLWTDSGAYTYLTSLTDYVGIGTTTPNNLLEVEGLISFEDSYFNTQLGSDAGANMVSGAEGNTYVGNSAGESALVGGTTAASYNTAVGYETLFSNTTGNRNTSVGTYSLYSNTTGHRNAAFGYSSLESNTGGYQNSAYGSYTLQDNTIGNYNNAIGSNALQHNTEGDNNNAMGQGALSANLTGSLNTAVGSSALSSNITGSNSTAIGYAALLNSLGDYNTAVGYNAGRSITSGSGNLFLGDGAGYNASQLATATNSIAIGPDAYTTASNQVVLGNDSITQTILNGNISLDASAYINWDSNSGDTGYGFRDSAGTIQYKNSGGTWEDIGSGSSLWTDGGTGTYLTSLTDYVGIGNNNPQERLHVTNGTLLVDNPTNPTLAGNYPFPYTDSRDVYISGEYAYIASLASGLIIANISDPSNQTHVGTYNTSGYAWAVHVSGKYAYVADNNSGLQIIDISNPDYPTLTGTYNTPGTARDVYISGKYAYVADYENGLQIIDISNPSTPTLAGSYDTIVEANGVFIYGKYAYVANGSSGIQIIDISDPSTPTLAGSYDTIGFSTDVYVSGKYAYVADHSGGLQIVNVSDPSTPTLEGGYNTNGSAYNVKVSGKYAYVADFTGGLKIIDISDPSTPTLTGTFATSDDAWGVDISGKYAYVAEENDVLQIIDIGGADIHAANIGNINTNDITVTENANIGNNLYVGNGLNVGIGGIKTDGNIDVSGSYYMNGTDYGQYFIDGAGTTDQVWTSDGTGRGYWADATGGSSLWTDGGDSTYLTSLTDDIGIGTDAPDAKLEVRLNSANDDLRLKLGKTFENDPYHLAMNAGMSNRGFAFSSEEGVYQQAMLFSDTSAADGVIFGLSTSNDSGSTWNPVLAITQDGNVGIGTATPSAKLTIGGSSSTISNEDGDINIDAASNIINFNSDSLVNFTQASGSSGTAAQPTYSFNSDNNSGMFSPQADNLGFSVGGTEAIRVLADGKVGIGVSNPDEKLTVDGAINAEKLYDITNKNYFLDPAAVSTSLKTAGDADVGGDVYVGGGEIFFSPLSFSTSTTEGTVYYDDDNDHLYMYDGNSTWHRIALDMTQYSDTNTVVDSSYIEITHNQNSSDIGATAWIYDGSKYVEIDDLTSTTHNIDDSNLTAWWKMEEASGNLDNAEGTAANDLTAVGSATYQETGKVNDAITLDGITNWFSVTDNDNFDFGSGSFSIGGWFKHDSITTSSDMAFAKYSSGASVASGDGVDGAITITSNVNINTTNSISGRSCSDGGDAVYYNVSSLTSNTANLNITPSAGCLSAGDDVLLINLAGSTTYSANVGNYEILTISSVSSNTVTFTSPKTKYYGSGAISDAGIGTGTTNQKVILQRVPNYTNVTVNSGYNFYPDEWNGVGGGVMAFKATGTVSIAGTIHANYKGYRGGVFPGGTWVGANGGEAFCGVNGGGRGKNYTNTGGTDGVCGGGGGGAFSNGTSYAGMAGSASYGGAGGGSGAARDTRTTGADVWAAHGGGGGYGTGGTGSTAAAGDGGTNTSGNGGNGNGGGGGGGTYGDASLSQIFFGSGGGGGGSGTLNAGSYNGANGGDGGGIIIIQAGTVTVSGQLTALGYSGDTSWTGGYGGGGAGGSIRIDAADVNVGTGVTLASGGTANNGDGGYGRIAINYVNTNIGSSTPAATTSQISNEAGGYKLYMNDSGNWVFGIDDDQNSFPEDTATSSNTYDDNSWHHVTAVKDGIESIKLYVDGQEVSRDDDLESNTTISNGLALYVGADMGGSSGLFAGTMDELFVYSRPLSAGEIEEVYQSNSKYAIEQVDSNTVRLYNYSGETQSLKLDVIVFGADLAEWYTVDDQEIGPGDLVSISGEMDSYGVPILRKSNQANDPFLIGAISTKAGKELGIESDVRRLLGLDGRIPVKIDPNSDPIEKGDHLTSSSTPGMARKAKAGELSIGRAFQDWDPNSGEEKLLIIINDVMATPSFGQDLLENISEVADLINIKIKDNWEVINKATGKTIESSAALAEAIIGKLKVGRLEVNEIVAPEGENLNIEGSNIAIELQNPEIDPNDPEASSSTPLGKLMIQNEEGQTVASFDSEGNAYISGQLDVEGISHLGQLMADEATISALLAENASVSGQLIAGNIESSEINTNEINADNANFQKIKADSLEVDSIEAGMISGLEERLSAKIAETLEEPSLLASLFGNELEQNDQYLEELNAEINDNLNFETEDIKVEI